MSEEREEELATIQAIFPEILVSDTFTATLDINVQPAEPLAVTFDDGRDLRLQYLPPLKLRADLPESYPDTTPPKVSLSSQFGWVPVATLLELQDAVVSLWEEYGHCQILFTFIDHIQQYVEQLDLHLKSLVLPSQLHAHLEKFDAETKQAIFDAGTYDCGICLEPKKGSACFQLPDCGHIFCKQCSQDFYNNAITEGDVAVVRCMNPECGKGGKGSKKTLHPRELLAMGVHESMARRYVEMKRKKKMESDKTTVFCPRDWCQKPARSAKYPPIPLDLRDYVEPPEPEDGTAESTTHPAVPKNDSGDDDRLAVCEGCKLAFCKTCFSTWHGSYVRCLPRDPGELTAEEKASYDFIMSSTSQCPTCEAAISKAQGCNHMTCQQCQTHFCYLCSAWLDSGNPYQHFNKPGTSCYQRLWELEEGDDGQAPEDGRGFGGARAAEVMALEAAREAEREEAEAAALHAINNPLPAEVVVMPAAAPHLPVDDAMARMMRLLAVDGDLPDDFFDAMEHGHPPPAPVAPQRRRRRNPFPAQARGGGAQAVRAHERRQPARRAQRPNAPPADDEARQEEEMRRFVELALRDEEDGWDSDEFAHDDAEFRIR